MKLKSIIIALALVLFTLATNAQKKVEMSLKQCLEMALKNDQQVRLSEIDQERLKYQKNQTIGAGLPQMNATGNFQDYLKLPTQLIPGEFFGQPGEMIPVQFGTNYYMSGGLQVSQLIYNQSYLVSLQIAKRMMEQGKLDIEKNRQNTVYNSAQLYYMALLTNQQIKYFQETLEKLDTLSYITKVQLEKQIIKQVDYDRVNVNRINLQTEITNLVLMLTQQLNMLKYFTGLAPEDSIVLTASVFDKRNIELPYSDPDNHINIRQIDKQKELVNLQMSMSRSQCIPSLSAFGDFSYINQQNDFGKLFNDNEGWLGTSVIGLSFNVPIFSGMQKFYQMRQSKVQYEQLNTSREYAKKLIDASTKNAWIKVQGLEQTAESQKKNVALAEDVYKVVLDQYSNGYTTLTDLLSSENAKILAQNTYAQTLVQLKIAELDLFKSNGNLMDILK